MSTHARNLITLLREVIGIYTQYEDLLLLEKESIEHNNLEEIQECVKKKETLLLKIRMLEESRKKITGELADALGVSRGSVDLSYLSKNLSAPFSLEFRKVQGDLTAVIQKIKMLNANNKHFLAAAIASIRSSFTFLNEAGSAGQKTYKGTGDVAASTGRNGMLLCQQV